jgi:hypothetical protein
MAKEEKMTESCCHNLVNSEKRDSGRSMPIKHEFYGQIVLHVKTKPGYIYS